MKNKLSVCLCILSFLLPIYSFSAPTIGDLDRAQSSIQLLKAKNEELSLKLQQVELNKKLGGSNTADGVEIKSSPSTYSLSEVYGGRRGLSASLVINGSPQSVKVGDRLPDGSVVKNITRSSVGLTMPDGSYHQVTLSWRS